MRHPRLSLLLASLAASLPLTGCPSIYGSCPSTDFSGRVQGADIDAVDDGDGVLSDEECVALCKAAMSEEERAAWGFSDAEGDSGLGDYYVSRCETVPAGAEYQVSCTVYEDCPGGRGHRDLVEPPPPPGDPVLAWLARMVHNERASVRAFALVEDELRTFGAPEALLQGCREAAREEVGHARLLEAVLRALGGAAPGATRWRASEPRSLLEFALENAVEGCVRETWGALEAQVQARGAQHPGLRAAMGVIAAEEARHAELSQALHAWAMGCLSAEERAVVEARRAEAWAELEQRLRDRAPDPRLGLPDAAQAAWLLRGLAEAGVTAMAA